jgi:hypothetical protein
VKGKKLRIYITITGAKIAGEELVENNTHFMVRGAAYLDMDAAHTQFNFHAIEFVTPEKPVPLRKTAMLTEVPMPEVIADRFRLYLEQLDLDAKKRALEK